MALQKELLALALCASVLAGRGTKADGGGAASVSTGAASSQQAGAERAGDEAPPAEQTGGFDGKRSFAHVAKQGGFWARPSGSAAVWEVQEDVQSELTSYGWKGGVGSFFSGTPVRGVAVEKNVGESSRGKPRG